MPDQLLDIRSSSRRRDGFVERAGGEKMIAQLTVSERQVASFIAAAVAITGAAMADGKWTLKDISLQIRVGVSQRGEA